MEICRVLGSDLVNMFPNLNIHILTVKYFLYLSTTQLSKASAHDAKKGSYLLIKPKQTKGTCKPMLLADILNWHKHRVQN